MVAELEESHISAFLYLLKCLRHLRISIQNPCPFAIANYSVLARHVLQPIRWLSGMLNRVACRRLGVRATSMAVRVPSLEDGSAGTLFSWDAPLNVFHNFIAYVCLQCSGHTAYVSVSDRGFSYYEDKWTSSGLCKSFPCS